MKNKIKIMQRKSNEKRLSEIEQREIHEDKLTLQEINSPASEKLFDTDIKPESPEKIVALYLRSTGNMYDGLSIEEQKMRCMKHIIEEFGIYTIVKEYIDRSAAPYEKRPGFLQLKKDCDNGLIKAVVAWDITRFVPMDDIYGPVFKLKASTHFVCEPFRDGYAIDGNLGIVCTTMDENLLVKLGKKFRSKRNN